MGGYEQFMVLKTVTSSKAMALEFFKDKSKPQKLLFSGSQIIQDPESLTSWKNLASALVSRSQGG